MLRSLNTGVSGIRQFQTSLDAIGNNLANINTVGYKSSRVEFSDTLNQTLKAGTPDSNGTSGSSPAQVGNGVTVAGVKNLFTQGAVTQTGVPTDMAVSGEGFFIVKNTATQELLATRAGDFRLDSEGYLVTNQGFRVQGFDEPPVGTDYVAGDSTGDIKFDKGTLPATLPASAATAGISNINVDGSGKIQVLLSDGSQYVRGQITLQSFTNPTALLKQGNNLYSNLTGAGAQNTLTNVGGQPNKGGLGRIESGSLEISNVDIAREFSTLITTQRAFQANAKVVTASDDILQEVIRIVR